jgi:phage terminase large subunit GpA-like protein
MFPTGFVHLPKVDSEFLQQLCAEQLITRRDRNGFAQREWQKMRERNEALDCYVYARAAAAAAGLDRFEERHWRELEKQLGGRPTSAPPDRPTTHTNETAETADRLKFGGGIKASTTEKPARRVVRSRWMT